MSTQSNWQQLMSVSGLPILEYIALDLCSSIAAADDTLVVQRRLRGRNDFSDQSVIVCLGRAAKAEEPDQQQTTWDQQFAIDCFIVDSDFSPVSTDTSVIAILAKVGKAVAPPNDPADPNASLNVRRRSGYAHDTQLLDPELFETVDGFYGITVMVNVNYSTAWNDPFTSTTKPLS